MGGVFKMLHIGKHYNTVPLNQNSLLHMQASDSFGEQHWMGVTVTLIFPNKGVLHNKKIKKL